VPQTAHHLKNTYASETPVTDGERVYAHFGHLGTYCFDMDGKPLWSKTWPPYPTRYGWGTASSPALHEGRLYLVNDNDKESFLVALDKATGEEIWRIPRDEESNWATPYVWQNGQRTEIVTCGTNRVRSYDLDGKLLWELAGMSSIAIPTPFTSHDLLYVTSGYVGDETRPVFAIRPGASGDISLRRGETSNEHIAWFWPQAGPYNPSPLVYGDFYYTLFDRGFLTCHEAETGKLVYDKQRFEVGASAFTASPWAYNGKLFCLSEDGDTFVVEAGPEYKLLGKNSIGEMCMATPAIARGSLILRTQDRPYRIRSRA
jgi:outer membrane protein assembly factor BamB